MNSVVFEWKEQDERVRTHNLSHASNCTQIYTGLGCDDFGPIWCVLRVTENAAQARATKTVKNEAAAAQNR